MIVDSIYHVGDTVWAMKNNRPIEFIIARFIFDSGLIGCDGNSNLGSSKEDEKSRAKTTVKYYLAEKSKVGSDGTFSRYSVESTLYYLRDIFSSKEALVYSLLK